MLRYLLLDHAVPAMWRNLAAAKLRADSPSGNAYRLATQTKTDLDNFAREYKRYTREDFDLITGKTIVNLSMMALAAAVDLDMAEANNIAPVAHQPRHCRNNNNDTRCFEQWSYENFKPSTGFTRYEQLKTTTTDADGLVEAQTYCAGLSNGVSACLIDFDGDHANHVFNFMIKDYAAHTCARSRLRPSSFGAGLTGWQDMRRRAAYCTNCGKRGVELQHPSWDGTDTGWASMPISQMAPVPRIVDQD